MLAGQNVFKKWGLSGVLCTWSLRQQEDGNCSFADKLNHMVQSLPLLGGTVCIVVKTQPMPGFKPQGYSDGQAV